MNEIKIAVAAQRLVNAVEELRKKLPPLMVPLELEEAIAAAKKALEQSKHAG